MPRHARIPSKTQVYHIMMWGNELKNIFFDEDDKDRFVDTLLIKRRSDGYNLYAYCVMDNHVHLLVKEGNEPIGKSIKKIAVSYAYYYNCKYKRVGHVFQDRYRSENVEDDAYLLTAMRYIHHNPEKAGICPRQKYQWSSYRFYMDESPTLLEIKEILKVFSKNTGLARQQFREFDKEVGEEGFLEIKAVPVTGINEENVEQFITRFLTENGMTREELLKNQEQTIRLVGQIKNNSSLSLRKIAIAIGINRETVRKLSQEPSR